MLRVSSRARPVAWTRLPSSLRFNSSLESSSSSPEPLPTGRPQRQRQQQRRQQQQPGEYTIAVRTWDRMHSAAEPLAIVQYLEKAFGKVDYFNTFKDGDSLANIIYVRFQEVDSVKRALSYTNAVPIPKPLTSTHEGGLGLSECEPFLERRELDPAFAPKDSPPEEGAETAMSDSFLVRFSPARAPSPYHLSTKTNLRPGELFTLPKQGAIPPAFLPARSLGLFAQWAGFAPIQPVLKGSPLESLDHPRMRILVRRHAEKRGVANPLEFLPDEGPQGTEPQSSLEHSTSEGMSQPSTHEPSSSTPDPVAELEPLFEYEDSPFTSDPHPAPHPVEQKPAALATTEEKPVMAASKKANTQSPLKDTPASSPSRGLTWAADPALEASQIHEAAKLLQTLQTKAKRPRQPTPPKPERPQKRPTPEAFLEKAEAETDETPSQSLNINASTSVGSEPELPKSADQKTDPAKEQGRLKKFMGGWF
ncbi:hypothetical protein V5O48_010409 [Marasmius crinis-equi]|uniref:Uncharacterized protein n=1 Tax=Marasmius crinis-equi TaxID=585013 RepID=A0ABR3F8U9_9AGAR